jgi:hypothetical protein
MIYGFSQVKLAAFLFNSQRFHQLQKIFGFKTQQLGSGGAIAMGGG